MRLLGYTVCPFTDRARAALVLKGMAHEVEYMPLLEPSASLRAVSPSGEGPVLVDTRGAVVGSRPILEYLEEIDRARPLLPEDPFARARARAWLDAADRVYREQCHFLRSEGVVRMEKRQEALVALLARVDYALAWSGAPYLGGDVPTMADLGWFPVLERARLLQVHTDHDLLEGLPELARYGERLRALEALQSSLPDDFDDRFVDFYLSGLTHFGRIMLVRRGRSGVSQAATSDEEPLRLCR